ncbi:MAG: PEP/pyruvate-binding domain-containing protein [Candidatus Heimdallarchaeota archaeon]
MKTSQDEESFYLEYKQKYKIFHELMAKRMNNVLLVSSIYDSFMLEEDGRLSDQIYEEFQNLNLRTLPRITRVSSAEEALGLLEGGNFDLVITMRRLGDMDAFSFGRRVKDIIDIPVILLLNNVIEIKYLPERERQEGIDRVFVWNGDSKIFVAIIKHLEDKLNAPFDTEKGNVRVFIFVDDSIRYYSLILPELYGEMMRQTHRLITEGTNDFQDLLKMRIRPKILLAETYEEASEYYNIYKENVMGIISDIEFPKNGVLEKNAGFSYIETIRKDLPNLPVILQSSQEIYRDKAEELGCFFISKKAHGILRDLRKWLLDYVGFGDFVFKDRNGMEFGKAKDVIDFYKKLTKVPIESLIFHGSKDHLSNWLRARGEFEVAETIKPRKVSEFSNQELRDFLLSSIRKIVVEKTRGVINDFSRDSYHTEIHFLRLRPGSLGGKGRGLAFLMFLLNSFTIEDEFEDISIEIPKTIVIGTDEFDKFMEENDLHDFSLSNASDKEIKKKFVEASLSESIKDDLEFLMNDLEGPLAVRSSSLLEDSAYQPFAGIFSTYMIPNNRPSKKERLEQLCTAIKLVYASPFLKLAKSYAETISQTIEESKMAVVIQQVVGKEHSNRLYPDFSGTASSYNYYPIGTYMKPEDRIAQLALGLGKTIVDGGASVRFCPRYPKLNYFSTPDWLLSQSQKEFYAVDLQIEEFDIIQEDPFVKKYNLGHAIKDDTLTQIADTYDFSAESLESGYHGEGSPVITFNNQLKLETLPISKLLTRILSIGEKTMGSSIEIEFAGTFKDSLQEKNTLYILQIRPFLEQEAMIAEDIESFNVDQILAYSSTVSGNLIRKDIYDVIYVKPDVFDKTQTLKIVDEIDQINAKLIEENRIYILIGFGRWGTGDRFLGIPVKWNNINGVGTIIESELEDFRVDFSQGSHFFLNISSANIGYLYIKHNSNKHFIDWDWLNQQEVITDLEYVKHIRVKNCLAILIDAHRREGMIIKPEEDEQKED